MLKVLEWIIGLGGLEKIQSDNKLKAETLYGFLDENSEKFVMNVPEEFRSYSNIVFDFKDTSKTVPFLESSIEKGFLGLNGHRSVGGIRVSNYNSVTSEMIKDFIIHLKGFKELVISSLIAYFAEVINFFFLTAGFLTS